MWPRVLPDNFPAHSLKIRDSNNYVEINKLIYEHSSDDRGPIEPNADAESCLKDSISLFCEMKVEIERNSTLEWNQGLL